MNYVQLSDEIIRLRETQKEGVYWDFKREHHQNITDLLHDILCLANAEYDGDRFLIFGIHDETMELCDLSNDENRRAQADILDYLKAHQDKFAESRHPKVRLEKITIESCEVDVLIISDTQKKPFYLIEKIQKVNPYHIYTRVADTNTPINKSASPYQIEQMWRAHFGLDQPPLKRAKAFLGDFGDWEFDTQDTGNGLWSHKIFPEFTIRIEDSDFDCTQEWTRGEIVRKGNSSSLYSVYYHQTRLARIHWVIFDNRKKSMVAPNWEPCLTGRFYYYERESIEFAMQLFHAHHSGVDHSKCLRTQSENGEIPVASADEVMEFLNSQKPHNTDQTCQDIDEQNKIFLKNHAAFKKWKLDGSMVMQVY